MNHSMSSTDNKYVLAIDVGSSTTKVGLIDQDGAILAQKGQRHDTFYLPGGGVEQNPEDWWKAVSNGAKEIIRDSELNPENIIAISTTSQWSVTVAVDERGSPLMNAISWMDSRGGKYNREIMKGFPSLMGYDVRKLYKWIDIVGFPPLLEGTDCIAHILTIKKEHPDIYRQAYKFLEPMDFINMRLTGKAHATACSYIACVSIDNRKTGTKNYNPWLLEVTGIDRQKLPDLLPIEGIVGNIRPEIALEWGLSRATPVITAASDNSAALIGAGLFSDYEPVAVLGTSGMLMFHVPQKKTDLMRSLTTIPGALNGRNIFSADTGNTARVLDYFLYQLVYPQDEFALEELPRDVYVRLNQGIDQIPPGSDNLLFLPWINTGVLAPVADRFVRGGFINITKSTTRSHLARAILEGIAYNWRWLKESAEAFAKHKFSSWRLCGGGATSDTWAQIMADVVGIPMQRVENPGSTSMIGMAFLAFNRLGLMPVEEIPAKVRITREFAPIRENQEIYDRMYTQFRRCQRRVKPIFHSLNKYS